LIREARTRTGTYSIVAFDTDAGELGVAVPTHWFAVGAVVPWTTAGVGAVATQANANVAYGPEALRLLSDGRSAGDTLAQVISSDPGAAGRQLAIVDTRGEVMAYTGPDCFPFAGHISGDGFSCQANLMASERVWPAMADAYLTAQGSLTDRMIAALNAGDAAGGDVRGRQSAAIEIVPAEGHPWERVVSLRVEDHPDPLAELERLITVHRAYQLASSGDWALGEGRLLDAARFYAESSAIAPDNHELLFWAGLGAAETGDLRLGVDRVNRAIAMHAGWRDLLGRLPSSVFPQIEAVRHAVDGPAQR
jgi:uncharacterized Ntn-hydrolase superfamily protein